MPFSSKAQVGKFGAMEGRGELPAGTTSKFAKETPGGVQSLPEKVGAGKKGAGPTGGVAGAHGPHEYVPFKTTG